MEGVQSLKTFALFFLLFKIMVGKGLINRIILKCIKRGAGIKTTLRYLSICYDINISKKALIQRYERISEVVSK